MKRAYKPLLFAFAIAVGLYIFTMKFPNDSFQGSGMSEEELALKKKEEGRAKKQALMDSLRKREEDAAKKRATTFYVVVGISVFLALIVLSIAIYGGSKR